MGIGFGMGHSMFSIMPAIMVLFILGFFIILFVIIIKGLSQWSKNNASPVLSVTAKVVAKRGDVSHHSHMNDDHMSHSSSSTRYYVTFQVESGDRMELAVSGSEYGMLVEGDEGRLTFQGTRYQGFERAR